MKTLFILVCVLLCVPLFGQIIPDSMTVPETANFFGLQAVMNQYFMDHPGTKEEKHWRRKEWFIEPRVYPDGQMENLAMKTISAYHKYIKSLPDQRATHGQWSFMGPTNVIGSGGAGHKGIGRVNSFAIHPTNANIIYIGSPNGGIWKTTNGGNTWSDISPDLPLLSITDLALDPSNPNIIYALTGDGDPTVTQYGSYANTEVASIGVIRSPDAGLSWYPTGFSFGLGFNLVPNALLIHPLHPDTQYVASDYGLFVTTSGWDNYSQITFTGNDVVYDIEIHPTNPNLLYCSGRDWIRRSTNGGLTWSFNPISDPDFIVMDSAFRVELAVSPDLPSAVYALAGGNGGAGDPTPATRAIFKSLLEGANNSWTIQDSTTDLIFWAAPYNIGLAVKDNDHQDVFAGGVESFRSYNSGLTWDTISWGLIHTDVHKMLYRNGTLYVATDGGLYKSTNDGDSWTNLWQGLGITEIYRIAGTPKNTNLYYMGTQDNGTLKTTGSYTFTRVNGGDGMVCQINYNQSDTAYASSQDGDMRRSLDGFATSQPMNVPSGVGAWITPMEIDPAFPNIVFVAKDSVFRSTNYGASGSWVYMGMPGTNVLNEMKQGTNNRNRMYVSQGSNIFRTDNILVNPGPATWTNVSSGLPNLFITGIEVDPTDANKVYVCMSNFLGGQKVFYSSNGGSAGSWTNISGSLPNVATLCLAFHDNGLHGLYVGTDIGVFYRDDNLGDWIYYSNSMPVVPVSDLYINYTSGEIVAGTYGRGLWKSNLYAGCDATIVLGGGGGIGGERHYATSNWISSTQDYDPDFGTNIHYSAGHYIDLKPGFEVSGIGFFNGKIGPCPPPYSQPMTAPPTPRSKFIFTEEVKRKLDKLD